MLEIGLSLIVFAVLQQSILIFRKETNYSEFRNRPDSIGLVFHQPALLVVWIRGRYGEGGHGGEDG